MLPQLADYATIILALAMINVVWQLEKAATILKAMNAVIREQIKDD